ncbi:MAG: FG-GAP repeat domain-containing protein, partial [Flavobacteriales bacterium]
QGDFNFNNSVGIPTSNYDQLFWAEDIDGNGYDDFFAYDYTSCRLIYSGGESNFASEPVDFEFIVPMTYTDYNNDGIKDFITHSGRSDVEFIQGHEDFVFTLDYRNYGNGPDLLEVADMNEDGYKDIVTSVSKEAVFYLQQFNDVYAKPTSFSIQEDANWLSGSLTSFMPYDREGDGDLDILVYDSPILLWLINEDGDYIADLVSDDAGGWAARVGDIDNDGFADAFVYQSPTKRYEASANGYSTSTINAGGSYFNLGDYDNNGNDELIYIEWTDDDEIELRRTTPVGGFTDELIAVIPQLTYTSNSLDNRTKMVVVDLDQNGFNDVLISTGEEDLIIWVKQFENQEPEVVVLNDDVWFPFDIEVDDLDGNGEIDVIIADRNNRRIVIMHNNGDGTFTNENLDTHIANPREVVIEDMNNDGDLDIIYSSARDYKIVVYDNKLIECDNSYLSLSETICASDSIEFNGAFISTPGLYTMTLENTLMCDSIIGLQLSNFNSDTPVIEDLGTSLSIESNWTNMQWFLEGELIDGETLS